MCSCTCKACTATSASTSSTCRRAASARRTPRWASVRSEAAPAPPLRPESAQGRPAGMAQFTDREAGAGTSDAPANPVGAVPSLRSPAPGNAASRRGRTARSAAATSCACPALRPAALPTRRWRGVSCAPPQPSGQSMQIYKVGGAVRDRLLGRPVTETDWVVVGAHAEELLARGFRPVGADFPVFLHPETGEEYALARTERKSGRGYGGFTFYAEPGVSLEDDLLRRDLTINA